MSDGPPGCNDKTGSPHCQPEPVYVDGKARALGRIGRIGRIGRGIEMDAQLLQLLFLASL